MFIRIVNLIYIYREILYFLKNRVTDYPWSRAVIRIEALPLAFRNLFTKNNSSLGIITVLLYNQFSINKTEFNSMNDFKIEKMFNISAKSGMVAFIFILIYFAKFYLIASFIILQKNRN
jgi:hypothetical protein